MIDARKALRMFYKMYPTMAKRYRKHHSKGLHTRMGGPAVTLSMKLPPFTKLAVDDEDLAQSSSGSKGWEGARGGSW